MKGKTVTVHRISVTDGAHPNGVEVVRAAAPAAPAGAAPALRTGAAARGRFIGAYIEPESVRWDQQLRDVAAREFNMLGANVGFGWNQIRPSRDEYKFCGADQLVAFAEANNMRVHAGQLTWGKNPEWLTEGKFSRDEFIAIMREHIQTVVGRYRGRVQAWNVVNAVLEFANSGRLEQDDFWMRGIGPEYIDMAFRFAREADPQAILLFNSADDEGTGCAARCGPRNADGSRNLKVDGLYEFVKGMRARGVPIDGVGMQAHWGVRLRGPIVDPATVAPQMKRLADLGLDVYITEMDVPLEKPATPAQLTAQAQTYRQMLEVCLAASNCRALIVWGVYDGDSNAQRLDFPTYDAPLLFDKAFRPKPAYEALAEVLRSR